MGEERAGEGEGEGGRWRREERGRGKKRRVGASLHPSHPSLFSFALLFPLSLSAYRQVVDARLAQVLLRQGGHAPHQAASGGVRGEGAGVAADAARVALALADRDGRRRGRGGRIAVIARPLLRLRGGRPPRSIRPPPRPLQVHTHPGLTPAAGGGGGTGRGPAGWRGRKGRASNGQGNRAGGRRGRGQGPAAGHARCRAHHQAESSAVQCVTGGRPAARVWVYALGEFQRSAREEGALTWPCSKNYLHPCSERVCSPFHAPRRRP